VKYLAMVGLVNLAVYLPLLWWIASAGFAGTEAIVWLWAAFAVLFMGARGVTLGVRAYGERWMVAGEQR